MKKPVAAAIFALAALAACGGDESSAPATQPAPAATCKALFGRPNAKTGLTDDQCKPQCDCGGPVWAQPDYDAATIQSFDEGWVHAEPYGELTSDPYAGPTPMVDPTGTVCAVLPRAAAGSPRPYDLVTYPSEAVARMAGAFPTHFGRCGLCSTLHNLTVYMKENDLAGPVRSCGLKGAEAENRACLEKLGFDKPCAQIWYFNTVHTREVCLDVCIAELTSTYHRPDGSLNPCIQCDEDKSGPVFKAVAGRTRRNSGLANALCRPCSEVQPLVHDYH